MIQVGADTDNNIAQLLNVIRECLEIKVRANCLKEH